MATNYLSLRSTVSYNPDRSAPVQGSLYATSTGNTTAWLSTVSLPGFSTITGSTLITSTLVTRGPFSLIGQQSTAVNRFIALGTDTSNNAYIDFHSSDAAVSDYSTRILSQNGPTIGSGSLQLYGSSIGINVSTQSSQFQLSTMMTADLGGALKTQLNTNRVPETAAWIATYNGIVSGPVSGVTTLTNLGAAVNSVVEYQSNLVPGATYRLTITVRASSSNTPYIVLTDRLSVPPDAGIITSLGAAFTITNAYATYTMTFVAPSTRLGISFVPDQTTFLNATTQWNAFTLESMDTIGTSLGYGALGFKNDLGMMTYGYSTPYQCTIASAGANGFTATQTAGVNYGSIPFFTPYPLPTGTTITFTITLSSTSTIAWWGLFNNASSMYRSSTPAITSTPTVFSVTITVPSITGVITLGFQCPATGGNLTFNNLRVTLNTPLTVTGGQVGIGTTSRGPAQTLDVYGTGRFTGSNLGPADDRAMPAEAYSIFGKSWQVVPILSTSAVWYGVAISQSGQYMTANIAGGSGTVWFSQSFGQTWAQATITANLNYGPITMSGNGQYQFCGVNSAGGSIYRSTNNGATWTLVSGTTSGYWFRGASSTDGTRMYITQNSTPSGNIWTSTDFGATWTSLGGSIGDFYGVACSTDGRYVYACRNGSFLYSSTNFGAGLTQRGTAQSWHAITCSANGQYVVAVARNTGIWYSNDYGVTWTQSISAGPEPWYAVTATASGQYLIAGTHTASGRIFYSSDYGVNWTGSGLVGDFQFVAISQNGLYSLAASNGGAVYRSLLSYPSLITTGMAQIGRSINNFDTNVAVPLYITGGNPSQARVQIMGTDEQNATWRIGTPSAQSIGFGGNQGHFVNLGYYSPGTTTFTPQLTLDTNSGNVGIGTASPNAKLHVYSAEGNVIASDTADAFQSVFSLRKDGTQKASMYIPNSSNNLAFFNTTAGINVMELRGDGFVYFPTSEKYPDGTLSIVGGKVVSSSDRRIKADIMYAQKEGNLDKLLQLKPATYSFIHTLSSDLHMGFIAQDVETLFPLCIDGKKYEYAYEVEKDEYGNDTNKPRFDENGEPIWKLDANGERMVRPRGFDDRALLAHTILSIQELYDQSKATEQLLRQELADVKASNATLTAQLAALTAWAQAQGFSA